MFRALQWYLAKRRLAYPLGPQWSFQIHSSYCRHTAQAEDYCPTTVGYDRLAALWDEYAAQFVPHYGPFLRRAGDYYGHPVQTVLDLACGTGLLTRQIDGWADAVVGLDNSEAMLREARARSRAKHVRFICGDFRNFFLDQVFDAVVCGSDSLNYVETTQELAAVMGCVGRHLRVGGLFVFDILGSQHMEAMAQMKIETVLGESEFDTYFFYDPIRRVSESRVVMDGVVERHRRIPLDPGDVDRAVVGTGLVIAERFSWRFGPITSPRQFYVLRRTQ